MKTAAEQHQTPISLEDKARLIRICASQPGSALKLPDELSDQEVIEAYVLFLAEPASKEIA